MKRWVGFTLLLFSLLFLSNYSVKAETTQWPAFEKVNPNKEWKITFSQNIDVNSVKGNIYIMNQKTQIPVKTVIQGNVLSVSPTTELEQNSDYTLVISNNIKNTKGTIINKAVSIPFTTVASSGNNQIRTTPYKTFHSEYTNMVWELPHNNYKQFYLVGKQNGKVVGGYETRHGQQQFDVRIGAASSSVTKKYGSPLKQIKKGNVHYSQKYTDANGQVTHAMYLIDGYYVTFFYDLHNKNSVRSIYWMQKDIEERKNGFFGNFSNTIRNSSEELMHHLINQVRIANGIGALTYTPDYNYIARNHSLDMIKNNYFSHTSLNGNTVQDRLVNGKLKNFKWYGENLAYGQYNVFYAHEALMNSKGHRLNILRKEFTHVLVGTQFSSDTGPYFTINFYSK